MSSHHFPSVLPCPPYWRVLSRLSVNTLTSLPGPVSQHSQACHTNSHSWSGFLELQGSRSPLPLPLLVDFVFLEPLGKVFSILLALLKLSPGSCPCPGLSCVLEHLLCKVGKRSSLLFTLLLVVKWVPYSAI